MKILAEQSREYKQNIYVCLIGYSEAFDKFYYNRIWKAVLDLIAHPQVVKKDDRYL